MTARDRRTFLGASEAPAVCGVDPFRGQREVWAIKRYGVDEQEDTEAIGLGNDHERPLIAWGAKCTGIVKLRRGVFRRNGCLGATLDALALNMEIKQHLEAKVTSLVDDWGDPDEPNAVPQRVLVQTHVQMAVWGTVLAWVPVLMPIRDRLVRRLYRVDRDEGLVQAVVTHCVQWWRQYVIPGVEPPGDPPDLDFLKRVRREPGKTVTIPADLYAAAVAARAARAAAEQEARWADAELIAALGDAERGTCDAGRVEYRETARKGYKVEPTTYRALRFKPAGNPAIEAAAERVRDRFYIPKPVAPISDSEARKLLEVLPGAEP